jgi:hypothetical protein
LIAAYFHDVSDLITFSPKKTYMQQRLFDRSLTMGWTIENALNDEIVHLVQRDDTTDTYRIRIGDLKTIVTIRLKLIRKDWVKFTRSHAMKTPKQDGPYREGVPFGYSSSDALHKAISGLTHYYREGVKVGHSPNEDWLVFPG